jgi:RNA polymerase sigma-70 factor, ECF subfamily
MGFKDLNPAQNSPQILSFPVEKQLPQLSINTDDTDNKFFYIEYYPLVFRRCLSILRNKEDAQDIAGDVFEKVQKLKSMGKFIEYPKTYLSRMAENMIKNKKTRERRELIKLYELTSDESINHSKNKGEQGQNLWEKSIIDNGYDQVEAEIIVKAILDEQDETTRKIYFNKYSNDMTLEQIGETIGLKKSAVQKRLKNLEKKVKEATRGIRI